MPKTPFISAIVPSVSLLGITTRGYAVLADQLEPVIERLMKLGPIKP